MAIAAINYDADPYIRRDSKAVIKRQYGVAGASFVDISRGTGTRLGLGLRGDRRHRGAEPRSTP